MRQTEFTALTYVPYPLVGGVPVHAVILDVMSMR